MTTEPGAGWWLYFWILALSNVVSIFLDPPDLADWILLIFSGIALAGLWGYLRNQAIGNRLFWAAFFGVSVLVTAYCLVRPFFLNPEFRGLVLGAALIGLALSAPLLLALWRYAFRSSNLWDSSRAA
ncbi:hypothetical protein CSC74_11845 [Pseudoxanthomonas yeongjuensis]|uniref:hypothetical protein n=1 Tax=Pseudoxanthomonas yeongjuensis TaxID=377616 RepID=UPI001390D51E|nr:hypothetical protein [Pseudoxanthomonas yeongjuensis]KAF1716503.1 hypothetical protein CSC74_11845 [Pseudoxanthomonas yeongjuensis]